MISKIVAIAVMILSILAAIKLLKLGLKLFSFFIWLIVISLVVYLALPVLDPFLQNFAKEVTSDMSCYGLVLESGDCFGLVR